MPDTRARMMNYRRIEHFQSLPAGKTLENYLQEAMQTYSSRSERIISAGDIFTDGLDARYTAGEGAYLYLVGYTRGDKANSVNTNTTASTLDIVPPPANSEFIDGAIACLVSGNHLFYCAEHLREGALKKFLTEFMRKKSARSDDDFAKASNFNLNKKGNESKIRQLRSEGIKSIKLNAGLYEAEQRYIQRQHGDAALPVHYKLLGKLAEEAKALYTSDDRLSNLHENENLFLDLEFKFNRVLKGGDIGQVRAQKMSEDIINSDEDGFVITTFSGQQITHDQIVLKRSVDLPVHGKAFRHIDAGRELKAFKDDLIGQDLIPSS